MINSNSAEPWSFGEEVEEISTNFIRLRYRLLPYLYQAFRDASELGTPVMRSLVLDYPSDERVYSKGFENQFLFGNSIMVAPLESYKDVTKVFLPKGNWYELFSGDFNEGDREFFHECGMQFLPIYIKASSIITMYPEIGQHTRDKGSVLEIHIYHGDEECSQNYYEDDGTSFDFKESVFHSRSIIYNPKKSKILIGEAEGSYNSEMKSIRIIFHGTEVTEAKVGKSTLEVGTTDYEFVKPISNFDPMVTPDDSNHPRNRNVSYVDLEYGNQELVIDLKS